MPKWQGETLNRYDTPMAAQAACRVNGDAESLTFDTAVEKLRLCTTSAGKVAEAKLASIIDTFVKLEQAPDATESLGLFDGLPA